jgi:hypothetical protein
MQMKSDKSKRPFENEHDYQRRSKKTMVQFCSLPMLAIVIARGFYLLSRVCSFVLHEKSLPCDPDHDHLAHDPVPNTRNHLYQSASAHEARPK